MRRYKFVQERTRERKFLQLPLSLYVLVHLCNSLDIVSHFFHHFGGSQDADTSAQAANPSIKLGADLNIQTNSLEEMGISPVMRQFIEASYHVEEKCKSCSVVNLCRGGCRRERDTRNQGALELNIYCDGRKKFFEYVLSKLNIC